VATSPDARNSHITFEWLRAEVKSYHSSVLGTFRHWSSMVMVSRDWQCSVVTLVLDGTIVEL